MRRFYLHKRGKTFYVCFRDPETGTVLPAKSTGKTDKDEASFIATSWLINGIPSGRSNQTRPSQDTFYISDLIHRLKKAPLEGADVSQIVDVLKERGFIGGATAARSEIDLVTFLTEFWDYEKSDYVREKKAYGQGITKGHCKDMKGRIATHWKTYFENVKLSELTKESLKKFTLYLAEKKKASQGEKESTENLSPSTINRILNAGFKAIRWAYDNQMVSQDVTRGIPRFSGTNKKKGVLSDKEIEKLFKADWGENPIFRLANLVAYETGLRLGEIVALRIEDIGEDRLFVRHSWSESDKLKSTKNNEERIVPLLSPLRKELLSHAKKNPHGCGPQSYIFWAIDSNDRPARSHSIGTALNKTLEKIKIDDDQRKARGISFHSWRHLYATRMAAVLDENTMKLTGHKTKAVYEVYRNHADEADFKKAKKATSEVFGKVLEFEEAE